tara:strand:- start:3 stop:119 length:117 start_codon:yes stop_codon:yes gene_type:complete
VPASANAMKRNSSSKAETKIKKQESKEETKKVMKEEEK